MLPALFCVRQAIPEPDLRCVGTYYPAGGWGVYWTFDDVWVGLRVIMWHLLECQDPKVSEKNTVW